MVRSCLRGAGCALALSIGLLGCQSTDLYSQRVEKFERVDAITWSLTLVQPWEDRLPAIRESAVDTATDFCRKRRLGMSPINAVARKRGTAPGTELYMSFRCVATTFFKDDYKGITKEVDLENVLDITSQDSTKDPERQKKDGKADGQQDQPRKGKLLFDPDKVWDDYDRH